MRARTAWPVGGLHPKTSGGTRFSSTCEARASTHTMLEYYTKTLGPHWLSGDQRSSNEARPDSGEMRAEWNLNSPCQGAEAGCSVGSVASAVTVNQRTIRAEFAPASIRSSTVGGAFGKAKSETTGIGIVPPTGSTTRGKCEPNEMKISMAPHRVKERVRGLRAAGLSENMRSVTGRLAAGRRTPSSARHLDWQEF